MVRELNNPCLNPWEKKSRVRVLRVHKVFGLEIWEVIPYIKGEKRKTWKIRIHGFYERKSGLLVCRAWEVWNRTKTSKQLKKHLGEIVEQSKSIISFAYPEILSMTCEEYFAWKIKREVEGIKRRRAEHNAVR